MAQQVAVEDVSRKPFSGVVGQDAAPVGGTVSVDDKPIAKIPPQAGESDSSVISLSTDPVLGVSTSIKPGENIQQEAAESVAQQVQGPSVEQLLQSATTDEEYARILALEEDANSGDDESYAELLSMQEATAGDMATYKTFVKEGEIALPATIVDPYKIDLAKNLAENQKMLDNMLKESIPDARVRQIFVDNGLGDFGDVLSERVAEMGRGTVILGGTVIGQSPLNTAAKYAAFAVNDYMSGKATSFSTAYAAYSGDIEKESQEKLDNIAKYLPSPTIGMAANNFAKEEIEKRVDQGILTREAADDILYTTVDGERVDNVLIDEQSANNILQLSFNRLPFEERFGVIALENVVGLAGFGSATKTFSTSALAKIKKAKVDYPDLLDGIDDPELILKTLKAHGLGTRFSKTGKINEKFVRIGMREQQMDATLRRHADDVATLGDELDLLKLGGAAKKGNPKYPNFIAKQEEYRSAQSMMIRARFTGKTMPLFRENMENSLAISAGQLASRELLPGFTGLDAETSEFIGALGMGLGGYKVVKFVGGATGTRAKRLMDGNVSGKVGQGFGRVMDFLTFAVTGGTVGRAFVAKGKGVFNDETIRLYEKSLGKGVKLTAQQRRGIQYATRLVQNMKPDQRDLVLKASQDYLALQERIVSRFPKGEAQEQAKRLFTETFAQGAALGPLAALNNLSTAKLNVRDLKNFNATELRMHQQATERQIEITERALDNFQNMFDSTTTMENREFVQSFLDNARGAVRTHVKKLNDASEEHLAALDDLEPMMFDDMTVEIPSDFFSELLYIRKGLKEQLGQNFDEKAEILRLQQVFEEGMTRRLDLIKDMRGKGPRHQAFLASTTEDFIDNHMNVIMARGREAYNGVEEFAKTRPPIDITPVVEKFIAQMPQTNIERLFSANGDFFNGKLGKRTSEVMQDMVDRIFPGGQIDQLRTTLGAEGKGLSDLQLALRIQQSSGDMSIFKQASPYEIETMRRAFGDYAWRLSDKDKDLSKIYYGFKDELNDLIRQQDPEYYAALEDARLTYRSEVGDRLRNQQFLAKVERSRQGGEIVSKSADDPYRFRYTTVDPVSVFDPVSTDIGKVLAGGPGSNDARRKIAKHMQNIGIDFGERVVIDGQKANAFDLTTAAGTAHFKALQGVIQERVYADWAEGMLSKLKMPRPGARGPLADRTGGYNFTRSIEWDGIGDMLSVTVKTGPDTFEKRSLVNLKEMISSENDIVKLLDDPIEGGNAQIRARFEKFKTDITSTKSQIVRNANNNIAFEQGAFDELRPVLGDLEPSKFYKEFILNGSPTKLSKQRDLAISLLQKGGKSAEDAEQIFDKAVKSLVSRGFLERAGLAPVKGKTLVGIDGKKKVVRQFQSPEQLLMDIDENREILEEVMDPDHIDYLEDIAKFMSESSPIAEGGFEGMVKGYSLNEGLSRLYNISRGMVSPLYVGSEFAVRLAAQSGIELMQLAGQDENAARIIQRMFRYPDLVTDNDLGYIQDAFLTFVTTELTKAGASLPDMLGASGETTTQKEEEQ